MNDIIIDDFINIHNDIKNIINNNDIDLNEKETNIICLTANINYPEYFSYYQGLNFTKINFYIY